SERAQSSVLTLWRTHSLLRAPSATGFVLVQVSALCVAAKFAVGEQPTLHLEYINRQHKNVRVESQTIHAPSTDRISLIVALEPLPPGAQQAGGERLEVRAENQVPGYFE